MDKIRIDELLVTKKLAANRSQAKRLIEQGLVAYNGKTIKKAGKIVSAHELLQLKNTQTFVSRGAYKLLTALEKFTVNPHGKTIADIGASTGGFTDLLLQKGAKKAYCIDVGKNQLHPTILQDPRVTNYEGINAKHPIKIPEKVDLVVADLSFISLKLVLPNMRDILKEDGQIITLFKPQFEAGPDQVGKDGVLKDPQKSQELLQQFIAWVPSQQLAVQKYAPSKIKGKKGNQEFLVLMTPNH